MTPLTSAGIRPVGEDYGFAAQHFYGIDGARVICDVSQSAFAGAHSDIRHPEVAWLIVSAAAAG